MIRPFAVSVIVTLMALGASAQEPLGIFEDHQDVGDPAQFGLASYDDASGRYTIEAGGETIGNESFHDEFHFVFKKMSGSFAIQTNPTPDLQGRGGLMIRQDLDADSVHVSWLMASAGDAGTNAGEFSVFPTFRTMKGGATVRHGDPTPNPGGLDDSHTGPIRLERVGNSISLFTLDTAGEWVLIQTEAAPMSDEVYVGLAVTAESGSDIVIWDFADTVIEEFPLMVFRTLPTEEYQPGAQLSPVTITAQARAGQTVDASVHEVIPQGALLSNVQAGAGDMTVNPDGTIDWVLSGFSGEATLTYDLKLGQSHSAVWQGTFDDGVHGDSFICADTILPKVAQFEERGPIAVDPFLPTLFEAEWGTPVGDLEDFGLAIDPRVPSGITVVSMDGFSASSAIEFTLSIPQDGTYYFFANARGEDGNSDSLHADVDYTPAGDDSSRWNINSAKQYQQDWVSSYSPSLDPRPFELTAGEHIFVLANRENSASVDWLAVTTNPNLNPANYTPSMRAVVSRDILNALLDYGTTQSSVSLSAYVQSGVTDNAIVTEIPPAGLTTGNISASAGTPILNPDGSISLDITGVTGKEVTLQYTVTAAPGTVGIMEFSGNIAVGSDPEATIAGDDWVYFKPEAKAPTGKQVYFFRNIAANEQGDITFAAYLEAVFGVRITLFDDTDAEGFERPADLTGADMAFVSGSVGSGNIAGMNYHFDSPVPMVTMETYLNDDFAFQADVGRGDATNNSIEILDNTHPITQGFPLGLVQIYEEEGGLGYVDLTDSTGDIRVLASVPGNPKQAVLFVVEKGATANGVTSPGIRIGTWTGPGGFFAVNADGQRLINQIFAYALGEEPPAPPVPTPTPPPPEPTATPTPTPPAAPSALLSEGFDAATVSDAGIIHSAATGFEPAPISIGDAPAGVGTDGRALIIEAAPGQGTLAILPNAVSVGSGAVLITASVRATGSGVSAGLAALNSPIDGQLGYAISSDAAAPVNTWGELVLLYDPPNDALQPAVQVAVNAGAASSVTVYIDNVEVKELPTIQLADVVLDGDGSFGSGATGFLQNINGNTGTVDFTSQPGKVVLSLQPANDAANVGVLATSLQGGFPHVLQASADVSLLSGSGGVTALVMTNGPVNIGVSINNAALTGTVTVGGGADAESAALPIVTVVQNGGPNVTSATVVDNLKVQKISGL